MLKDFKNYEIKLKAGVVARYKGRVLLIKERHNPKHDYKWNIIKGTFEPGKDASILETAIREAKEEANAKIKLKYFLSAYYLLDGNKSLMMFAFIADLLDPKIEVSPQEIQMKYGDESVIEVKLFNKQELSKLKPEDFVGRRGYLAVRDYLKGTKFPLNAVQTLPPK